MARPSMLTDMGAASTNWGSGAARGRSGLSQGNPNGNTFQAQAIRVREVSEQENQVSFDLGSE